MKQVPSSSFSKGENIGAREGKYNSPALTGVKLGLKQVTMPLSAPQRAPPPLPSPVH